MPINTMSVKIRLLSMAILLLPLYGISHAKNISTSDFGVVGLIDMPTARMREDGAFSATLSRQDSLDVYNLSYQALPWLEATFRYSIFDPRRSFNESSFNLRDRSYEVKIRLLEESDYLPEFSAGLRDILGTGVFGAEYLVASKSWQNFDATIGLGWGRLAGNDVVENPLTSLSSSFETRNADVGLGGEFSINNYFSGPNLGVFGGLEYVIPAIKSKVQIEYNSDNYEREVARGILDRDSRFSYGIVWEPMKDLELGLSWQHGSEIGLRLSASTFTKKGLPARTYHKPWKDVLSKNKWAEREASKPQSEKVIREDLSGTVENLRWYEQVNNRVRNKGLLLNVARVDNGHLSLEYYNKNYQYQIEAVEQLLAILNEELPKSITSATLINVENNMRAFAVQVALLEPKQFSERNYSHQQLTVVTPIPIASPQEATKFKLPNVQIAGNFGVRYSLFDPIAPLKTQLNFSLGAKLQLPDGWTVRSEYIFDIVNDFDRSNRPSNSVLPRVRSDVNRYLEEGESGLNILYLEKYGQLAPNFYYRGYAGVLEEMFSGIGAEFLYRPNQSRWAFGGNINAVKQRAFDKGFGTRDYEVVTGHFSVYWATPYDHYDVAVHMGRYLAKDWGATFELTRTFSNGWQVGLFATLTDVPFDEFGEGSFDKGFTFKVPLNLFSSGGRTSTGTTIRPIQRDGGARLDGTTIIWNKLRSTHYDRIQEGVNKRNKQR